MAQNNSHIESDRVDVHKSPASLGILEIAWRRKSLVGLGVLTCLIGAALFYVASTPIYQSKAQVLVVKARPDAVTGLDTRHLVIEDYVATTKPIIESPLILDRAIKMRNLDDFESFAGKEDPLDFLSKSLTVARNKSAGSNASNVLDLSFRGIRASEAPQVLAAIIESFKEYLDDIWGRSRRTRSKKSARNETTCNMSWRRRTRSTRPSSKKRRNTSAAARRGAFCRRNASAPSNCNDRPCC